jgi:hypothetical protein
MARPMSSMSCVMTTSAIAASRSTNHARGAHVPVSGLECALLLDRHMPNANRNRKNQPPTGEGKRQSPHRGEPRKLMKRSEVVQAQRFHPELNIGDSDAEAAFDEGDAVNPNRPKAGR